MPFYCQQTAGQNTNWVSVLLFFRFWITNAGSSSCRSAGPPFVWAKTRCCSVDDWLKVDDSVIGDVGGPYWNPSGVAATVRVDARFQGTIVRELRLPLLSPESLRTQTTGLVDSRMHRDKPCSAVSVLRNFPIVLSSVESRITLIRGTVRDSWFPSRSSLIVCSAESCSSPCRVLVSTNWRNRGCWPLLWPLRSCRHCTCRCWISGNYRTGAVDYPIQSPESLRTQTAVRHRRFLCPFKEAVAIVWKLYLYFYLTVEQ